MPILLSKEPSYTKIHCSIKKLKSNSTNTFLSYEFCHRYLVDVLLHKYFTYKHFDDEGPDTEDLGGREDLSMALPHPGDGG